MRPTTITYKTATNVAWARTEILRAIRANDTEALKIILALGERERARHDSRTGVWSVWTFIRDMAADAIDGALDDVEENDLELRAELERNGYRA